MVQSRDPKTGRFISTGKGRISIAAAVGGVGGAALLSLLGQSFFAWLIALVLCSFALCLYVHTKYGNKALVITLVACIIVSAGVLIWRLNSLQTSATLPPINSINQTAPTNSPAIIGDNTTINYNSTNSTSGKVAINMRGNTDLTINANITMDGGQAIIGENNTKTAINATINMK